MIAASILAAILALFYLSDYENAAVDPQFYIANALGLLQDHLSLRWGDLLNMFLNPGDPDGNRPRFLTYLVALLDFHLRYSLYDYFLIPPTLSLSWIFQLILGPYCLYRLMQNATRDRQAAWLTLAVYLSSVGFLSGVTFGLAAGKALSNVVYILALFLVSGLDRQAAAGRLLFFIPGWRKYPLLVLLFLGPFLDEMPLFAYPLLVLTFPNRFLPPAWTARGLSAAVVNLAILALPLIAFFQFSIFLAPMITEHYFHYYFDYMGAVFNSGGTTGPFGMFSPRTLALNFLALFGSAVVPLETKNVFQFFAGADLGAPSSELATYMICVPLFVLGLAALALCRSCLIPARRRLMARAAITITAFLIFFAAVQGRHGGWAYGYYYGSVFAVLFALMLGIWFAAIRRERAGLRLAFVVMTALIVAMQIHNTAVAQHGVAEATNLLSLKTNGLVPAEMGNAVAVDEKLSVNRAILEELWTAWRQGRLEDRLREAPIPVGALYLVSELRFISHMLAVDHSRASPAAHAPDGLAAERDLCESSVSTAAPRFASCMTISASRFRDRGPAAGARRPAPRRVRRRCGRRARRHSPSSVCLRRLR